ncbi:Cdk-activating kinase assembly factor [Senna tora]|uniref:Cdk-activating kinase assembly factor n=1 Tax=Senna tora TaxID=362788 RepID=A0A834TE62_9FABA|nr:Cdk-activating kinase assembly factor [Senna tora]
MAELIDVCFLLVNGDFCTLLSNALSDYRYLSSPMWNFGSTSMARNVGLNHDDSLKPTDHPASECSDDETSMMSKEEGLECPICVESFNIVENVPHVLWCGHTLCKNCILGLQWAVVKIPTLPIQLPLFISCPWCNLLSFRLVYNGNVKFPCKNYFLLWMVESMNGDRVKTQSTFCGNDHPIWPTTTTTRDNLTMGSQVISRGNLRRGQHARRSEPSGSNSLHSFLQKLLVFLVHLTAKFPLIIIFLMIVLYAIPASAAILALYILVTILFAFPSLLMLYFAYPSLEWLVREIIT